MNDLVNALQTLALVLTLGLTLLTLVFVVYALAKLAGAFQELLKAIKQPHIHVHTATVTSSPGKQHVMEADAEPDTQEDVPEDKIPPALERRYKCHRCNAKLPAEPTHSVIKETINYLVFKCRRCGKETEIDPEKTLT